jgi:hypothetical protein
MGGFGSNVYAIVSYFIYGTTPRRAATRAPATPRDVAIDCVRDDREIAADDGRRCARGEARRPTDATEARATSRGFDVGDAGATRATERERVTDARTISKRVVD